MKKLWADIYGEVTNSNKNPNVNVFSEVYDAEDVDKRIAELEATLSASRQATKKLQSYVDELEAENELLKTANASMDKYIEDHRSDWILHGMERAAEIANKLEEWVVAEAIRAEINALSDEGNK